MEKKKVNGLYIIIVAILVAISCFLLSLFSFTNKVSVSAAEETAGTEYLNNAASYQGENGWYNYSGSFEEKRLVNMFYGSDGNYWQGERADNKTLNNTLTQYAYGNADAIRAYLVSSTGKMTISGTIEVATDVTTSCNVSIVLCKNLSLDEQTVLYESTELVSSAEAIDLSTVETLQGFDVEVGDGIFFVVSSIDDAEAKSGASFCVTLEMAEGAVAGTPASAFPSTSIPMNANVTGDFAISFGGGAALRTPLGLIVSSMRQTGNNDGRQQYVAYRNGTNAPANMTYSNDASIGYRYSYLDINQTGIFTAWFNEFYSNMPIDLSVGVAYNVPKDGTMSILGAYATAATDGSARVCGIVKISKLKATTLWQDEMTTTIQYFADDAGTQNLRVEEGDIILVVYSAPPWCSGSMSIVFDYFADPFTLVVAEKDEVENNTMYYTEQGANGWYYAYGDVDKYVMMTYGFDNVDYDRWNGIEWNTGIDDENFYVGAYMGTMSKFVCDRSGTMMLDVIARQVVMSGTNGVNAKIYLNNDVLWEKDFAYDDYEDVYIQQTFDVKKGDVITFHVKLDTSNQRYVYDTEFCYYLNALSIQSDNSDYVEGEDLSQYITPMTYSEYNNIVIKVESETGGTTPMPDILPGGNNGTGNSNGNGTTEAGGCAGCGGCNSSIIGASGFLVILALGGAIVIRKRRD